MLAKIIKISYTRLASATFNTAQLQEKLDAGFKLKDLHCCHTDDRNGGTCNHACNLRFDTRAANMADKDTTKSVYVYSIKTRQKSGRFTRLCSRLERRLSGEYEW